MRSSSLGWRQALHVVLVLGWADFLLKYRGSFLGFLWSFIIPLVKFIVILHVFRPYMREIPAYALYLFLGLILWEHFAMTTNACLQMPHEKAAIIRKIRFPRLLLALSVGWLHLIVLAIYLLVLFLAMSFYDLPVLPHLAFTLLLCAETTLLALGIGMLLAAFTLRFRDIPHLWMVGLQVFFWLTPIVYPYSIKGEVGWLPSGSHVFLWHVLDRFIAYQPLSWIVQDARGVFLDPVWSSSSSGGHMMILFLVCAIVFLLGAHVFRSRSQFFIQEY